MRFSLIFLVIFSALSNVLAQKMFDEQFSNCPVKFVLEDQDYLIEYQKGDSIMVVDFLSGIEEKQKEKLQGAVMMQIMVDTANNVCCVSYTNKSTLSNKKLDVVTRIGSMQGWKRLPNCNSEENVCALVSVVFTKSDFTVIRTGYNRNKGRKILQSVTYERYSKAPIESQPKNE